MFLCLFFVYGFCIFCFVFGVSFVCVFFVCFCVSVFLCLFLKVLWVDLAFPCLTHLSLRISLPMIAV